MNPSEFGDHESWAAGVLLGRFPCFSSYLHFVMKMVREGGLEPPSLSAQDP